MRTTTSLRIVRSINVQIGRSSFGLSQGAEIEFSGLNKRFGNAGSRQRSKPNRTVIEQTILRTVIGLFIFLGAFHICQAQSPTPNRADYRINIKEATAEIIIDGLLQETDWELAEKADSFYRVLPIDTGFAGSLSVVRMTYDQDNLYLAVTFYDPLPGKRPVESLRRDFSFGRNDNFLLFMDTYNDQTNGFSFGLSAAGAQWDGIQSKGGSVSLDWDCKWKSAVQNYSDKWVMEMAIPFRSIRYQEDVLEWGINFSRLELKRNEKSSWAPVPRQFPTASLAYTGTLVWDKAPPKARSYVSFIPYVTASVKKDYQAQTEAKPGVNAGIDAKIGLTPTLNLDLTINPDFSQVEVDRQVTNLDRFELFFPERRRFFLENRTLFSDYGEDGLRPFFSRRVGLNAPVIAGARLSGNLSEDWRVGLLNMQTAAKDDLAATNYTVASLQRKVFARSNVGVFMVNKQLTGELPDSVSQQLAYNRIIGADYNLASADNRWTGKLFYHQALRPDTAKQTFASGVNLTFKTQKFSASWEQYWVGSNYLAEAGFVRRKGYLRSSPSIGYKFFPSNKKIANHGPSLDFDVFWDADFQLSDREFQISYDIQWLNRSAFHIDYENGFVRLLAPFDPTNTGGDSLLTGETFNWQEVSGSYSSDGRKLFNYEVGLRYGGYFNGTRLSLMGELNYRVQPYGSLALVSSYNQIRLPAPYTSANLILIGPRLDITFSDELFLTTFVQYNNQIDNLNVNLRLQWRFAPVSDLFIVYTDNYDPALQLVKNRALVLKLSYWLN